MEHLVKCLLKYNRILSTCSSSLAQLQGCVVSGFADFHMISSSRNYAVGRTGSRVCPGVFWILWLSASQLVLCLVAV